MPIKIATWNVNSVRLRLGLIERFLREAQPDVLCLQETKCPDPLFPAAAFAALGWPHVAARGEKGYNGVAILSRLPLSEVAFDDYCARGDSRHLAARLPDGMTVHNYYVPAGGDKPDRGVNPKFAHKLDFLSEMTARLGAADGPAIVAGDLNIAPLENDVWSHKHMSKIVSHTPVEIEALARVQASRGFVDLPRRIIPPEERLYSWWSYRARDWRASGRGLRLDHLWATPDAAKRLVHAEVAADARGWERPSDHAPVVVALA